ncbi:MAG: methylmalonyl-CoA mutase family protein [Acidimicrobiales bacterium]
MTDLDLGAEFPTPHRDEWLDAVEKVLRGKSFEKVLVGETRDGLDIQPLYTADGATRVGLVDADPVRLDRGWDVRQVHDGRDPAACARLVCDELERGVTSVELVAPPEGWTLDSLREATTGVLFDLAPVVLSPHGDVAAARALHSLVSESGHAATAGAWLGLDPIGETARTGVTGDGADTDDAMRAAAELAPTLPNGRAVTVDSTRYADAGATEAEELAWSIATGVAYLRALEAAGLDPAGAAQTIGFRLSAGADQFVTIATLRAARRLWRRVLDACGVSPDGPAQVIQAVTSRAMYSRRDPWVNMLRATTATLAAGVGGADAVTVLPFDDAIGESDGFSRRVARNTQLLLIEESHLALVVDPAAGSWFVESLTDRLANAAWAIFQKVEADGGIEAALADGTIAAALDAAWNERLDALGTRRTPITGVSEFPNLDETVVDRPTRKPGGGFPIRRLAAPFEALRDGADRVLAATGRRPTVHLAALGPLATHTARSTWITNFLAVGGVAVDGGDTPGADSPLEAEAKFAESGATVAVICSSDGVYAERAAATATALKEAGATKVALAGAPGDLRDELTAAGVDEFWHVGVDVLDALTRLHADLGV